MVVGLEVLNRLLHDDLTVTETSLETFFVNDTSAADKMHKCPRIDANTLKKELKEGDIVIIYRDPKYLCLGAKLINKFNQAITKSSFMSIKIVGREGKTCIGYGAQLGFTGIKEVPIDYMLQTCLGILHISHKDITASARKLIVAKTEQILRMDIKYSIKDMLSSVYYHRKDTKRVSSLTDTDNYYLPMFCTTLIALAYKHAGLNLGVSMADDILWPIDIIKSDKFKAVGMYLSNKEKDEFGLISKR